MGGNYVVVVVRVKRLAIALSYVFAACSQVRTEPEAKISAPNLVGRGAYNITAEPIRRGPATRCRVTGLVVRLSPASYSVFDVGKPGVPSLGPQAATALRGILKYRRSPSLRFASIGRRFIVFDAIGGPCSTAAPGYFVLNGACNEYYLPSDDFSSTHAESSCLEEKRPWMNSDMDREGDRIK